MSRHGSPEFEFHAAPEDLLRFLDGELRDEEISAMRLHLANCGECRSQVHRYAQVTSEFSRSAIASALSNSGAEAESASVEAFTQDANVVNPRRCGFAPPRMELMLQPLNFTAQSRSAAAGIAVTLIGALLVHVLLSPPRVSARSVVATARQVQRERQSLAREQTMERILRVTRKAVGQPARVERWASMIAPNSAGEKLISGVGGAEEILSNLPTVACRAFVPLSIDLLDCLLKDSRQDATVEEIRQGNAVRGYRIALGAPDMDRIPLRSQWTIQGRDWRLSKVEFQLGSTASGVRILVEEEAFRSYRADPPLPLVPGQFQTAKPVERIATALPQNPEERPVPAQVRNRLRAFEAITAFYPSPEEDLRMRELPGGAICIEGIVLLEDRREELRRALLDATGVVVAVQTQEEAVTKAFAAAWNSGIGKPQVSREDESPVSSARREMRSEGPMLLTELEERFGRDEAGRAQVLRFSGQVLNATQELAFCARWLQRLDRAFAGADRESMGEAEIQRFNRLREHWLASVHHRHEVLQTMIRPILCSGGCNASQHVGMLGLETAKQEAGHSFDAALRTELALLKTMFVDRAFLPVDTIPGAKARWREASSAVLGILKEGSIRHDGHSRAITVVPHPAAEMVDAIPHDAARNLREVHD
ncbi:MAG: zf-HC2 domain-containing protein [Bryobacterales bacterium]|nr:zf-HC2 domain-containing protein [Bryobacterales bacterium]MCZ2153302.1 zf-HC2 domain-containing protein [Bryobacterales bacterium]